MDRQGWWATIHRVAESDVTEATEQACVFIYIHINISPVILWITLLTEVLTEISSMLMLLVDLSLM